MSVFADESLDSHTTAAYSQHLQAPISSAAGKNPFGEETGDGFATPAPRSASNSVAVAVESGVEGVDRTQAASSAKSSSSPMQQASDSNPFAAVVDEPAAPVAASASPPTSSPVLAAASSSSSVDEAGSTNPFAYGSASASSSSSAATPAPLSDVSTATPNRLAAVVAALPSYTLDDATLGSNGMSGGADERQSKHGRIVVGEPELKGGKFTSYHVYKVSSAASTAELVWRRYSDFVWLRNLLVKSFPGIFIPPLPAKQAFGNLDSGFVENRRLDLQRWLQRVVVRSFLAEHEGVCLFLERATASFNDECVALTKATEARPIHEVISKYMDLFPELARLPANDAANTDVDALAEFIKQSEIKMQALHAAADKFVGTTHASVQQLGTVNALLQQNYELEKAFVASPPPSVQARGSVLPRIDIADSFLAWHLSVKWTSNAYDDLLLAPFKFELQDIGSMGECLRGRADLLAKHAKSVKTAAKWTASPANHPKNEKQEAQKQMDEAQAKDEGLLLDLVNKLILHAQFDAFWTFRMTQFRKRLHQFAEAQMEATKQLGETWMQIHAATAGTE